MSLINAKISRHVRKISFRSLGDRWEWIWRSRSLIRRLLLHPEVELSGRQFGPCRTAARGTSSSLTGRTSLRFENLSPAAAAAGCDVALRPAHKVSARPAPELLAAGVNRPSMFQAICVRDASLYKNTRGRAPAPGASASSMDCPSQPRGQSAGGRGGPCSDHHRARLLPLARAGLLRGPVRAWYHGLLRQRRRARRPDSPVRAVRISRATSCSTPHTPEIIQTSSTPRGHRGPAARGFRFIVTGVGALYRGNPRHVFRAARRAQPRRDRPALRKACAGEPLVPLPEPVRGRCRLRFQLRGGQLHARRGGGKNRTLGHCKQRDPRAAPGRKT